MAQMSGPLLPCQLSFHRNQTFVHQMLTVYDPAYAYVLVLDFECLRECF